MSNSIIVKTRDIKIIATFVLLLITSCTIKSEQIKDKGDRKYDMNRYFNTVVRINNSEIYFYLPPNFLLMKKDTFHTDYSMNAQYVYSYLPDTTLKIYIYKSLTPDISKSVVDSGLKSILKGYKKEDLKYINDGTMKIDIENINGREYIVSEYYIKEGDFIMAELYTFIDSFKHNISIRSFGYKYPDSSLFVKFRDSLLNSIVIKTM